MTAFTLRFSVSKNPLFLDEVVADEKDYLGDRNGKPQFQMEDPGEQFQKPKGFDAEYNGREGIIFQKRLAIRAICAKDPFSVDGKIDERRNDPRDQCRKLHGSDGGDPFVQDEQQNIVDAERHNGRGEVF